MSNFSQSLHHDDDDFNPYKRVLDNAVQQHSSHARKVVFVKAIYNIALAISVMFFPGLVYNGPIGSMVSKLTGLRNPDWAAEADSAFTIAALMMGAGVSAFTACQSESNCAYRTIAAFSGAFALTGLTTCFLSPHRYGSSFLLLISLQNVFWYISIVRAGGFGFADCLGVSTRGLYVIEERLSRDVRAAAREMKEEIQFIEERGKEKFGVGGGGGHHGTYSDAVKRDTRSETEQQSSPGVQTRGKAAREQALKKENHKKGLERSDLGAPIPSSVN